MTAVGPSRAPSSASSSSCGHGRAGQLEPGRAAVPEHRQGPQVLAVAHLQPAGAHVDVGLEHVDAQVDGRAQGREVVARRGARWPERHGRRCSRGCASGRPGGAALPRQLRTGGSSTGATVGTSCRRRPPALQPQRHRPAGEAERGPDQHVEDVVVGRQHRGGAHDDRHEAPDRAQHDRAGGGHQGQADEQVPADVQARQRGVLVDEGRRLQDPVGARLLGDRVDEPQARQPGRRDRVGGVDAQPHQAGRHHGVAQAQEDGAVAQRQPQQHADDHRPVAPDVDPVGHRRERVDVDEERLHPGLDVEAELLLDRQQVVRVVHRDAGVTGREARARRSR